MTVTVNGTTGVSLSAPASVPQNALQGNVAGNGPCFSAFMTVAQSIPATTQTKMVFGSKEFDTATSYSATNSTFQPLIAGYYYFTLGCQVTQNGLNLYFKKNNSESKNGFTLGNVLNISGLIYLNGTTDYVEAYVYVTTAGSTIQAPAWTYFQAFLARSA